MASVSKSEKDWEAESAADSLIRAEEVKNNPKLLKSATAVLKKRQEAANEAVANLSSGTKTRMKRRNMV